MRKNYKNLNVWKKAMRFSLIKEIEYLGAGIGALKKYLKTNV